MSYFGNPLHTPVVQWAHHFLLLPYLLQLNRFNMFIKRHKNLMNDDVYVLLNQTQSFLYALAGRNQSSTTALSSHAGGKFEVMPRHHHQIDDAATCSAVVNNAKSIHLCVCVRGALMGHRTPSSYQKLSFRWTAHYAKMVVHAHILRSAQTDRLEWNRPTNGWMDDRRPSINSGLHCVRLIQKRGDDCSLTDTAEGADGLRHKQSPLL